ncbi:MAG: hypothetical protein GEU73_12360 [Chloroflexi bacterium]|nr:hypothetical protein [Chloroflexota bacterium]
MERLATQTLLSYKGLFFWLHWPGYLSNVVARPMLMVIMWALLGRFASSPEMVERFILGWIALSIPEILLGGIIQTFAYERSLGVLPIVIASPTSRAFLYYSRAGLHCVNGLTSFALSVLAAVLFLGLDIGSANWPTVLGASASLLVSGAAFSLFVGNIALLRVNWTSVLSWTRSVLMVFTGAIIPIDLLPGPLQPLTGALPVTHGLAALRQGFAGAGAGAVGGELAAEVAVALAYGVVGLALFVLFERTARDRGTLEYEA